ncbi:hypothetical protein DFA_03046 [Cavenderia fasciculata]|uniref:DUF155 domain-containing protein n=1 Tax=Cavenderia fasciculata TaxID=261658 RepID=F4PGG8_CACFS|nr:uncharacterized protein DFA_03046 [Cavenderia fasciculata]EGG24802.1 hypothetical protein DFA_03046 [Cavenderia fasciculata]|eukprot:XP_004362653.1 hypothetical protein DFA_03046 [Cavenderia fasciculata]
MLGRSIINQRSKVLSSCLNISSPSFTPITTRSLFTTTTTTTGLNNRSSLSSTSLILKRKEEYTFQTRNYKRSSTWSNRESKESASSSSTLDETKQQVLQCSAYCISKSIQRNVSDLPQDFSLDKVFPVSNVMWLRYAKNTNGKVGGDVYIFPSFGCVVLWGIPTDAKDTLFTWLKQYSVDPYSPEHDTFSYVEGHLGGNTKFDIESRYKELITLSSSHTERFNEMFATSYALAQSVRLNLIEAHVYKLAQKVENIPDELAKHGTIAHFSKRDIVKQLGEQMKIRNFLNLHTDIIDTPEHFWEHTEGEGIYKIARGHCEIDKRVRIMNERLNLISGIYDVINDEMKHSHSIRLERIIIALIAIEAALGLANWYSHI